MAAELQGSVARRRRAKPQMMSQINVTPMVDVMLVLLIVFMITAPLLTAGVPVDLPRTAANPLPGDDQPLAVSIKADGTIYLQESEIALEDLVPRLAAVSERNPDVRILLRGDEAINYGRVMEVMGALNAAGFANVGLVTRIPFAAETKS
ncbi:MAG: protein TolR [Proteobacteria bacterium]|nr:protein TolR [Pseudomonadota bacterium]